ncbi:retrovirus-related Pol polyprotein from transposon 17.6 [Trichonephila clavipes]|nr:retrovirus-related Pol polyprotein from transposon 17.6 [Trichonephila clavipes]
MEEIVEKSECGSPYSNGDGFVESTIASPLTNTLKGKIKKEKITWDEKCGKSVRGAKSQARHPTHIVCPDFATEFILQTDASEVGAGVVLSQRIGKNTPSFSKQKVFLRPGRLTARSGRNGSCDNFWSKRLKHYLDGQRFIIETDHNLGY